MLIGGKNVVSVLISENPALVKKCFLREGFDDKILKESLERLKLPVEVLSKNEYAQLEKENSQGIMVDIGDFPYTPLANLLEEEKVDFLLLLDHLEDPHNLGAIIRTAEAAGVNAVLLPKDRSVSVTPTVAKTSAGSLFRMPIVMVTNLHQTIDQLKKAGFWIVGTDMENSVDYRSIDYRGKIVLVVGNEGKGMSALVKKSCDFIATIPMVGKINSLNASVATGIMVYEVFRNRK